MQNCSRVIVAAVLCYTTVHVCAVSNRKILQMCVHSFCSHGDDNCLNSLIKEQEALLSVTVCGSAANVCVYVECKERGSDGLCLHSNVSAEFKMGFLKSCRHKLDGSYLPAQTNFFGFLLYIVCVI